MQKRALGDRVMVYVLAVIILGGIAIVGWKMVSATTSRFCKAELADFQLTWGEISKLSNGAIQDMSLNVPCKGNKLLVFDSTTAPDAALFSDYPLIQDGIRSNTGTNVFVLQGKEVVDSFAARYILVDGPHMLCISPTAGKISLRAEGSGAGILIRLLEEQQNCISEFSS